MEKYPVGTQVRLRTSGIVYEIIGVTPTGCFLSINGEKAGFDTEYGLDTYYDIVSDPAPIDQELKINFIVTGESQFGRWFEYTAIDEEDGKATARVLSKGLAPGYKINLTKVYTTPSPESVDF